MGTPLLEEVFRTSGVPTYTFVEPEEWPRLLVALRSPGRGVVVEGPSGIGKTSAVDRALSELGIETCTRLSARKRDDVEYITSLPDLGNVGLVVVDDFHRLPDATKSALADYLKILADEGSTGTKVVVLGINTAGERLIQFAGDLLGRIDVITFESEPEYKIQELLSLGERALNISLNVGAEIVAAAQGSFYIAQMLCHEVCIRAGITEAQEAHVATELSFEGVRAGVWDRLKTPFYDYCRDFSRGTKMRSEGRAPYLHILNWLASGREWSLSLEVAARQHQERRGSVTQVVEKGYLEELLRDREELREVFHYDSGGKRLSIEDPRFVFFVRNIPWHRFALEIGFKKFDFERRYDFALSFAGPDRDVAEALFAALQERELEVFYDRHEQHRILAADVEEYLRPIYQSEASFVICLLGPEYPHRIWTKFESDAFRTRFGNGEVIPIWFDNAPAGIFDESRRVGGITLRRGEDLAPQVASIADLVSRKLVD